MCVPCPPPQQTDSEGPAGAGSAGSRGPASDQQANPQPGQGSSRFPLLALQIVTLSILISPLHPSPSRALLFSPGASLRRSPPNWAQGRGQRQRRAAPVPVPGTLGARVPVRPRPRPPTSLSALCGLEGPAGLGNVCALILAGALGRPGVCPGSWRQDGAPRWVTPFLWSSRAPWLRGKPGLGGQPGHPFQQPRGPPPHSHPSLRLLEFMTSPRRHKSRWEPLSALSSRQQTAKQGFPVLTPREAPRPPEALTLGLGLTVGQAREGPQASRPPACRQPGLPPAARTSPALNEGPGGEGVEGRAGQAEARAACVGLKSRRIKRLWRQRVGQAP